MITEENIELINWAKVPFNQITSEIIEKFGTSFPELKFRLWIEELFSKIIVKIDEEKYPGSIFLFLKDKCYFELVITEDAKFKMFYCSYEKFWSIVLEKFETINDKELRRFLGDFTNLYFMKNPLTMLLFQEKFDCNIGNIGYIFMGKDYFGRDNVKEHYRSGTSIEEYFLEKNQSKE